MTEPSLAELLIGLVGPLPPPSGGMANQTRQLGELLTAAGASVITAQVNAPYLAQDSVNATLVPPGNPAAMAQACLALLADAPLWQQRAQAGLLQAQRYTWARVQPVLAGVYRQARVTRQMD